MNVCRLTKQIHWEKTQKFAGFRTYRKLYFQLWNQVRAMPKIAPTKMLYSKMAIKTPWWLFIKPMGQLISYTTVIDGSFSWRNGVLDEMDARKFRTWKLCGVPLISCPLSITKDDVESIAPLEVV